MLHELLLFPNHMISQQSIMRCELKRMMYLFVYNIFIYNTVCFFLDIDHIYGTLQNRNQCKEYIIEHFFLHICKMLYITYNVIDTISSGHEHLNTEGLFSNMVSKHLCMYK